MRIWQFNTRNFRVELSAEIEQDPDLSWDDDGECTAKLESGEWTNYCFAVRVYGPHGEELGADYLGNSIYADPMEFATDHRSADPMNRNCTIMRAAWRGEGNPDAKVSICHYFPDMVRTAIAEARKAMADLQGVRIRAAA